MNDFAIPRTVMERSYKEYLVSHSSFLNAIGLMLKNVRCDQVPCLLSSSRVLVNQ